MGNSSSKQTIWNFEKIESSKKSKKVEFLNEYQVKRIN